MSVAVAEELRPLRRRTWERASRKPCADLSLAPPSASNGAEQPGTLRAVPFASIDELESALAGASYLPDRGLSTALYLSLKLEKPLLLEGEAGVGKTEAAKAIAQAARRAADPPPVLRGPRRRARRLRVELRAPAAAHPGGAGGNGRRGGAVRARVPDPAAAARGGRGDGAGRAPDRRDRPRRRGVRGVSARGALGLPDHDPRARARSRRSSGRA